MKKTIHRLEKLKYALLTLLILYIAALLWINRGSTVPFEKIRDEAVKAADISEMKETDERAFKKLYGLNKKDYEKCCSYYSDTAMGVEELLLIRTGDEKKMEALQNAARERIAIQIKSFEGYGEEQTKLLKSAVLLKKGNLFLMAVSPDAERIKEAFVQAL